MILATHGASHEGRGVTPMHGSKVTTRQDSGLRLTRTTQQANHAPSPSEWGMRVGAAYTQTGVLAKGRAKGSAGEIEELGRKLGLAGASPPPKAGTRREAGTATQVP